MSSPRTTILRGLLLVLSFWAARASSAMYQCECECPKCPSSSSFWHDAVKELVVFVVDTCAVLLRGFSLGFGAKLTHLLWQENFAEVKQEKIRVQVVGCMYLGFSTACLLLGLSQFVPLALRRTWMGSAGHL
uniref:Uncharacterized protein n=1 Tax=Pinguiococcus pyrenoidosus TaxID=172671 RepID=A0A7R9UBF0_9STRA|mmetsp:Transcript_3331/g.13321  ORF Transcript_3331/g.13321 Transcript_3331/m.13321 type:complete len:132 (+) Transcript_3331:122-517(+)